MNAVVIATTHRHTDIETDGRTDRLAQRCRDRQTDIETERDRQTDIEMQRQTDRHWYKGSYTY